MLTDKEKYELKFYKKRSHVYIGMIALFMFFYWPLFYLLTKVVFNGEYINLALFAHLGVLVFSCLIEFILIFYRERAYAINVSLFNGTFLLLVYPLMEFTFIFSNHLIENFSNWILVVIFVLSFIFAQIIEIKTWKIHKIFMEKNKILCIDDSTYDLLKERDLYKGKYTVWHGYSLFVILVGIGYQIVRHYSEIQWLDFKKIVAGVATLIVTPLCILYFGRYLARGFLFLKLEKEKKTKIYTNLMKYIRMEDEINEWRKGKGLKPVKIKSFFFNGDIEK